MSYSALPQQAPPAAPKASPPAPPALPPQPSTRREQNKAATREAIAAAALAFLRTRELGGFTVDDVAAAAGVSRRTFFNYFSSVEAAVASFTQAYLDAVIEVLVARPREEPLLESAHVALSTGGNPDDLAILAETFALTQAPQLARFQLQAWEECRIKLTDVARDRLPAGTDELYLHTLVGGVIGSCRAAFQAWFQNYGTNVSPESLAQLRDYLQRTVHHISNGFNN